MLADEQGFMTAIADRPEDDAIRLIYADWLDEHDAAPQATFLRQEVAWLATDPFAGPPHTSSPTARALLKDASQTAMTLDDGWLMHVSRTRWELHRLLWRFLAIVLPTPPYDHRYGVVTKPDARWVETVRNGRAEIEQYLRGKRPVETSVGQHAIPIDFWFFLTLVRTCLRIRESRSPYFRELHGLMRVSANVNYRRIVPMERASENVADYFREYGEWLFAGTIDHTGELMVRVCVDTGVPHWGKVIEIDRQHPTQELNYYVREVVRQAREPAIIYETFSDCFADRVRLVEGNNGD